MSSIKEYIRHLHTIHCNSLKDTSPIVEVPDGILKVSLHLHQKAILNEMEQTELKLSRGMHINNELMFSNYAILGDSVGAGKSLMVLGHIARLAQLAPLEKHRSINVASSSNLFSILTKRYTDISEAGSLIIVPHTLFRQWSDYITKQTTLKHFCIARTSQIDATTFLESIMNADVVLISNTICKFFLPRCKRSGVKWKRVFVDEADTIHMVSSYEMPRARFYWFVTASWINLIYMNHTLYLDRYYLDTHVFNTDTQYKHLNDHFKSRIGTNTYYIIESLHIRSYTFFKDIIAGTHPTRSNVVLTCSDELIQKSIMLPPLHRHVIWCRASVTYQIIHDAVSLPVQQMLHAGDITGALETLGVKGQNTSSLIEAVTANLQKELVRLEKTYTFKESMEYSTPQAKELALQSLIEKISRTKDSIKGIEERIKNFATEMCPICYEEPNEHLITPCCSRAFCTACLLLSIAHNPECPLCRAQIHPSKCTKLILKENQNQNQIVTENATEESLQPKKHEALLKLLKDNPNGRFLVFSRYDNPFDLITKTVNDMGINVRNLKGSKDTIASILSSFDSGAVRCLLLNSQFAGAGLNITAATHVILLHAMSHEEEKQILGRSYRLGRKGPLTFIKLLNKGEETYTGPEETNELI